MVELLSDSENKQQTTLLLDLTAANNSVQACRIVEAFIADEAEQLSSSMVNINVGELLLTRGVLSKIKQQVNQEGATVGVVFATLPQTQQAALSEGLYVKEDQNRNNNVRLIQHSLLSTQLPPRRRYSDVPDEKGAAIKYPLQSPQDVTISEDKSVKLPHLPLESKSSKLDLKVQQQILEFVQQNSTMPGGAKPSVQTVETDERQSIIIEDSDFETLYLRQNLRSGQTISFNGNIIVIGDAHAGSEILAGGDIVIWGELRGIAHAGAKGNIKAQIRAMKIEALQLRIGELIARRPDKIYYHKERSDVQIAPELAKVLDGEIRIFRNR